jgi:hypothetical protein
MLVLPMIFSSHTAGCVLHAPVGRIQISRQAGSSTATTGCCDYLSEITCSARHAMHAVLVSTHWLGFPPLKRRTHVKVIFHTVSGQLCFRNSWHSGWLPRLKTLVIILTPPSSKFHHPGWTKRWYVASTVHAYVLRGVILPFDRDRQFFVVSRSEAAEHKYPCHGTSPSPQ